jgi:hypothetical protein
MNKMKNYSYFILLLLLFSACNKEIQNAAIQPPQTWYPLPAEVRALVPAHYQTTDSVIFFDATGKEKVLYVKWTENTFDFELPDRNVSTEAITTILCEKNVAAYSISVTANFGSVGPKYDMQTSVNVSLSSYGYVPAELGIGVDEKKAFPGYYQPSAILNGKHFSDVYVSEDWPRQMGQTAYTQLYFHRKKGIIAFRDHEDALWVLKE